MATLFVATPRDAQGRLCESLDRMALEFVEAFTGVLAVHFSFDRLQHVGNALDETLADSDRQNTRCRIMPRGAMPQPADLMQAQPLAEFLGWIEGQWLADLIADRRLVTYFQPIVRCDTLQTLFAYECLTRGVDREGHIIAPDRMFAVARESGMLVDLDLAARFKAIETVARLNVSETMFININPNTILEPCECVEGALRAVLDQRLDPQQFVFEVVESERVVDADALVRVLAYYREAGFRVALDDVGAGYNSLNLLGEVKPDFVKLDRKLLHGIEQDDYKAHVAAKVLELARDLGLRSVAEGIETESQWQWAREHGADFAQGFYLARPAPLPVSTSRAAMPITTNIPSPVL